ncbi:MAG: hypothetical protein IJ326_10445 [Lachnospiraceae bacterium]|nr:hypothetical protein [Lachnospiraceae bacterium]
MVHQNGEQSSEKGVQEEEMSWAEEGDEVQKKKIMYSTSDKLKFRLF